MSFHPTAYVAREELNNYISKLKARLITGMFKNQIENQFWWRVMTKNHLKNNILILQVFKEDGELAFYIDGQREPQNWMKLINCARNSIEQNLALVQDGKQLFYESCRDIIPGEELLVWYGNSYNMFMGIPTGIRTLSNKEEINEGG